MWRKGKKLAERKKISKKPLHGSRIEDYALIGDCLTGALVSRNGSIDWLCWPNFSSGACFAALLGTCDHGYWKITPASRRSSASRRYHPRTMILETTFKTSAGEVLVTDFMPILPEHTGHGHSSLVRIVTGIRGKVDMHIELAIRFDYGRTIPWVTTVEGDLHAVAGQDMVVLRTATSHRKKIDLKGEGMSTVGEFPVHEGETVSFTLTNASALDPSPEKVDPAVALEHTRKYWTDWASRNQHQSEYGAVVERSLITLKALTYNPSGGIIAALTTSLPEKIGGVRNWDYRYCWLRDTAFTLLVLMRAGYTEEAVAWRRWLLRAVAGAPDQVQTIYGICGERQLPEWTADWLPGYEGSKPVRIGNAAVDQFQLDVFGEVLAALARTPEDHEENEIRISARSLQAELVNHLCEIWQQPDEGIWEVRGERRHFTHSKVMAWVALDRAIKLYERFDGNPAVDIKRWKKNRDAIHKEICEKGFNKKLNSFTQSYGSKDLDASCLRLVLVGFLPPEDPRIRGTVEAIEKYLMKDGFVMRYNTHTGKDGLPAGEGSFLACSFWMASNLWLIGRHDEARVLYERLLSLCNDVGLISEEYDPTEKRMLGNFPQALSHIALIHTAFVLAGGLTPEPAGKS